MTKKLNVLPTSRAIRDEIENLKSTNQLLDKYITIGDLFQRVALSSCNKKFPDKNLRVLYLIEAINNCDIEALGFSRDFSVFLKQSDYIFKFFLETATQYVDFDQLLQYDTYALYSDHLEILKKIYQNYTNILEQNNFTDNILLPSAYKLNKQYITQYDTINIAIDGYLTKFEYMIIQDIAKYCDVVIDISFNQYNTKNFVLFNLQEELEIGYKYSINITTNKIIKKLQIKQNNKNIVISPTSSKIEQIGFIKYQISKMYQDGISADDIAVIVPDEKISSIIELFDKDDEHYFNFAMGRSIVKHKIVDVLKLIPKMIIDKEPKDIEKFKYLKIDQIKYEILFKKYWNNYCTQEIFEFILEYLFSFETDKEVLEKLELVRIKLHLLLFSDSNIYKVRVKEFLKILLNEINSITIDDVNGGKITVLGILETRSICYKGIIVVDFNDEKIPKISVKDKFLSTNIKKLANLPTIDDRENLQRYYYKNILTKAQSVAIAYVDDDISIMSRFIVQLFPDYKTYIQQYDYKDILYNAVKLKYYDSQIKLNIDLSKQTWSSTSFTTYLKCKRAYYFKYIKNIKDHNISIKPEAYEVGNIIHNALETAVKQNSLNDKFVDDYMMKFQNNNPYLVLDLELWKKRLKSFFVFEKARQDQGIVIHKVEKPFNFVHNGIRIKGQVDRIDKYPDNRYEILDYKTSGSLKVDTLKTYEHSVDFQLEFYYLSQRQYMINSVGYYALNDTTIKTEIVLEEKLKLLDMHFEALKTKIVDFIKTEDKTKCTFCSYKVICNEEG